MTVTTFGPRLGPRIGTALRARSESDLRRDLRAQIVTLERELSEANARLQAPMATNRAHSTPRMLSAAELESVRDELITRLMEADAGLEVLAREEARHDEQRALLRRMHADPTGHRWTTVTTRDLGEPGCRRWQSRPILGVIGLLSGWWRVRVSSGCP